MRVLFVSKSLKKSNKKITSTNSTPQHYNQCNCRVKSTFPLPNKCLYRNTIYKATVKTNNSIQHYIGAMEGTIKQRIHNHNLSFKYRNYASKRLLILVHMATKRHKHLSHNHLGDTKTSTCLQQNIKKCLLCLHEKLAIITYPSQNTLLNKKSEILSKCRHKNKHHLSHFNPHTHTTHLTPRRYIKKQKNPEAP